MKARVNNIDKMYSMGVDISFAIVVGLYVS